MESCARPNAETDGTGDRSTAGCKLAPPTEPALVSGEAVEQPGAAGAYQTFLAAASRSMGRVPGNIAAAMPVVMADLRTTFSGTGPVIAGVISLLPRKIGRPIVLRSGQNVMPVGPVATPVHQITVLVQSRSLDDIRIDVELIEIDGDQLSPGVVPGPRSDSVAGGNGAAFLDLGAEIRPPRASGGARSLGQLCAMGIGPFEAAQIRALAHTDTRDEEPHGVLAGREERRTRQGQNSECGQDPENVHVSLPIPHKESPVWSLPTAVA